MAEIKPTIQYVPDLAKSAIILALTYKLGRKSGKEKDGVVRIKQVLINRAGNADDLYAFFPLSLPRISSIIFPCSRQMDRRMVSISQERAM